MPGSIGSTGDIVMGLTERVIRAGKTTAVKLTNTISNVIKKTSQLCALELPLAI